MFMRNKITSLCRRFLVASPVLLAGLCRSPLLAQASDARGSFKINLPTDSPVGLVGVDSGESKPIVRGGAVMLDLHSALVLRNTSARRIRGVTLIVLAQEVTPGGKGSVMAPSLDVAPGETFPIRIDVQLLRPIQGAESMPVQIGLDGVLFDDLSFYGPNRLSSRRPMIVAELEAQRDRKYFKSVIERAGVEGLQKEMLAALARQPDRQRSGGIQMVRGRSTNYEAEHEAQFAFLEFPDSPVEALGGHARVAGNEAREARIEIHNRSVKPVRYVELGWMIEDQEGREFLAGAVPAELSLGPGQKSQVTSSAALRFPDRGGIKSMTAFISNVEFGDGRFWIPSRAQISSGRLQRALAPSPEEQRLVAIYSKKGIKALVEELKKF